MEHTYHETPLMEHTISENPYAPFAHPQYVSHRPRLDGIPVNDATRWLVLEASPSFWVVFVPGEGVALKRKRDYARCD